jgi:protein-tyrosine kinase
MEDKEKQAAGGQDTEAGAGRILSDEDFSYYRGLAGQIEIGLPQQSSRVLLFTSSLHGEGTTEVVIGLGLTLAAGMGRKTAIIDWNPIHPELHRRFDVPPIGMSEYLRGEISLEQSLVNTTVPYLHVMPLGRKAGTLTGLSRDSLIRLLDALRSRFDYVLIDSAPLGINAEATMMCDKADAVVMVVRHGKTKREVVRRTKENIERAGGKILGIVFNRRTYPIPGFIYKRL